MPMIFMKFEYRCKYYWKAFWTALGVCPKCWTRMNITGRGRYICTNGDCK